MSLFRRESRSLSYQDVFARGGPLPMNGSSETSALRLAPVYAAVSLIADGVARLPLHEYRETPDGRCEQVDSPPLITDPTALGTRYDWKFQAVTSLGLRGNAWGLPTGYDSLGRITRVEWLHPDDVELNGEDDILQWRGRKPEWLVDGRPTPNLLHIRNFVLPGRILGLSPIGAFKVVTETGLEAQQFGRDWFRNGSTPSAVLESDKPIDKNQAAIIKERFVSSVTGRQPAVLGAGLKYRMIQVSPNESQFLETIRANATTIASIFHVPPEDIGGETGGNLTYNSPEHRAKTLVTFAFPPYMGRLEESLSTLRPRGRLVKFNADAMLRPDTKERYEAHGLALTNGWKNVDEVRLTEDLPPLPNGQGQQYKATAQPTPAREQTP